MRFAVQKAEFKEQQKRVSDVTGDGMINAKDALQILRYAVKLIDQFPVEAVPSETPMDVTSTNAN